MDRAEFVRAHRAGRRLHSAETKHFGSPEMTAAERIVATYWEGFAVMGLPKGLSDEVQAFAFVNIGRWMVRCPFCTSAQNASRDDHRFFCTSCMNLDVDMQWVAVIWPDNSEEIEAVLIARPRMENRNWEITETYDDLVEQNREHGLL